MFSGFYRPRNFYRLPNDWFDRWRAARAAQESGRIIGPLKVTEYVIKWTWGYQNFDRPIHISWRGFQHGRVIGRERLDQGTGLSPRGLGDAINTAITLGFLERYDEGKLLYLPHLCSAEDDPSGSPADGFASPHTNYFLVPAFWTDLTSDTSSEALILAVEYLFRHTWGWEGGWERPCWLTIEEIATGRRYRSSNRIGERYDKGIGYTERTLQNALADGVKRGWLVWQETELGRVYALHLKGMQVAEDGRFLGMAGKRADERAPLATQPTPSSPPPSPSPPLPQTTAQPAHDVDRIARLETRMQVVESRIQGLETRMQVLETRMQGLESRMQRLETGMQVLTQELLALRATLQTVIRALDIAITKKAIASREEIATPEEMLFDGETITPFDDETIRPFDDETITPQDETIALQNESVNARDETVVIPQDETAALCDEEAAGNGRNHSAYYTDTLKDTFKDTLKTPPPPDTRRPAQTEAGNANGGAGGAAAGGGESELPDDLCQRLVRMNYRGQQAWNELITAFQAEPARIGGWIRYVSDHRDEFQQPAGFLLQTVVRDGAPLPANAPPPTDAHNPGPCRVCKGRGTVTLGGLSVSDPDYGRVIPCPVCNVPPPNPQSCRACKGRGTVTPDLPVGHPDHGRVIPCPWCRDKVT
ncbi:MAG: hypothetical protein N2204_08370 [Anaerolineae bacterium]|nr:hypothetical protein [Anaerolineae bacterium]